MKKSVLLLVFLCAVGFTSRATHLMGGQMTSRNIGGLTYEVTVTAYRDTLGIPMYDSTLFHYSDATASWTQARTVAVSAPSVFGNGVEEYTYVDTIVFPAPGSYSMYYEDCCRNCAILNIPNPCGYSFHLYNNLLADPTNSSPVFLNPPIPLAQVGVPFLYDPLPFDADGDSIVWALDTPVTALGTYVSGYTVPPSDSTVPFAMDPVTGVVTFLPTTTGHFEVSVLVNEFRGGVQIGQIRRDMQIIVVNSGNRPVMVSTSTNSGYTFDVLPGSAFNISVTVLDPDFMPINLVARGEPFVLPTNPATSSVINGGGVSSATISWTPSASQARVAPYIFALRVDEPYDLNTFNSDITFRLNVHNVVAGIVPVNQEGVRNVYPNPNNGNFTVEIHASNPGKADLVITTLTGQQVQQIKNVQLNEGVNAIVVNSLSLSKGSYMISVVKEGKTTSVRNFEVVN